MRQTNEQFRESLSHADRARFDRQVEQLKAIRNAPDYVSDYPPSTLIDNSPEGQVRAAMSFGLMR